MEEFQPDKADIKRNPVALGETGTPGESSKTSFARGLTLGTLLLFSVALLSWWSLEQIKLQTQIDQENTLNTILHTTNEALHIWAHERKSDLAPWSNSRPLAQTVQALIKQQGDSREAILTNPNLASLRSLFQRPLEEQGYLGFSVIGPDHKTLGATRDSLIGTPHLLSNQDNFLERVFSGETLISLPMVAQVLLPNSFGEYAKNQPTMFVAGPIRNEVNQVMAVLAFRIDPHRDFTRITQLGRLGVSGETYAFDKQGKLLTESRFDQHLIQTGLLRPGERAILAVDIRDPGGNLVEGFQPEKARQDQPLTAMASSAIDGNSGVNLEGYNDYRGVPVVGVWLWDKDLGFGMTTEMDVSEAYASFRSTRWLVVLTLSMVLVLFLGASIAQARGRVNALKLADSVRERESRITAVLDNVVDAIITLENDLGIESFNNAAEHIFGYHDSEIIGKNFQILLPRPESMGDAGGDDPTDPEPVNISAIAHQEDLMGLRKDGSLFPMELNYNELDLGDRKILICIVRDISERLKAEAALQRAKDELEQRVQERTRDLESAFKNAENEMKKRREFENSLQESNAFLSSVLDSPTDISIISTDLKGLILYWNKGAENLLGYTAGEMVNKETIGKLYPPDSESARIAGEAAVRIMETKTGSSFQVEELTKDGKRVWVQLTLSPRFNEQNEVVGILGIGGNITDQKRAQEELAQKSVFLQMLEEVAHVSSEAPTPDEALSQCLKKVCTFLKWPMGNLFLLADDASGDMICSPIHHVADSAVFKNFRKITEGLRLVRGEGLPGRVLQTASPIWVKDMVEDLVHIRAREARESGLLSGFGFPILVSGEVVGVMEFFSTEMRNSDPRLLEIMSQVGHQLGRIINRKRADQILTHTTAHKELFAGLVEAAYHSTSFEEAMQSSINHLCTLNDWETAQLLWYEPGASPRLISADIWHSANNEVSRHFKKVSLTFPGNSGFPGEVTETKAPLWLNDLESHRDFKRAHLAAGMGYRSAWAFPIMADRKVLAVLEAFDTKSAKPDKAFLDNMERVTSILGQLILRRNDEESYKQREERYLSVLNHAPVGIITLNQEGDIQSFNPASEFILGYPEKEVSGKNISHLIPEAYTGGKDALMVRAAQQPDRFNGTLKQTVVGVRNNGTPVHLELAVSRSVVEGKDLFILTLQYVSTPTLKTEHVSEAENQSRRSPDQPLDLVPSPKKLSLGEQMAEIANETITVAHDFNSPVFGVRKLAQHLKSLVSLNENQQVLFDLLERKLQRIGRSVRKLKDFYRPQSGIGGPLDINEVIEDILTLNQTAFKTRNIKLEKHFADELPKIDAVSDQIHQALQNLIRHSEESIPENGGELMVATEHEGEDVKIYILDSGNVMTPGTFESMFDPMQTSEPSQGEDRPDLPLQYSINIIQTHGGQIDVSNREGKGNLYTVTLPIKGVQ